MLAGLLLVAIEEVVDGNKVVDVSLVLVAVGDVVDVELLRVVVVAALVEAVKKDDQFAISGSATAISESLLNLPLAKLLHI